MSTMTPGKGPVSGVVHSVTDLAGDVLEIFELQVCLARQDAKDALRSGFVPLTAIILGISLMVAALPVLAFAIAKFIQIRFGIPEWVSQLGVGTAMIVLALMMSLLAFRTLKRALTIFGHSTSELSKNLSWLKSVARREQH